MLFNSYTFIAFLIGVLTIYYMVPSWKMRKVFLLISSYLFYAAWNPPFVLLLWISTIVDWFLAKAIHRSHKTLLRRSYLGLSLLVNLGLLSYFKYGTFLLDNFVSIAHMVGIKIQVASPNIILPVGISFYTFQTLSYTLDVYLRRGCPWHSFLDYALYVTFFPQLVAGPIVRASHYLPQCEIPKEFRIDNLGWGGTLIVIGLFEKIVIADGLLAPLVEAVYDVTETPDFLSAWCGTLAFSGQIFCDFAGYSTCAIGVAQCLGFHLPDNFRFPYAAVGFSDFWKRWHISLSSWLRDYLYIPLGGNRRGVYKTYRNLMFTMLLGGLWHGASWSFVVWGALHGMFLAIERVFRQAVSVNLSSKKFVRFILAGLTFLLVSVAWCFFRAANFERALDLIRAMGGLQPQGFYLYGRKLEVAEAMFIPVLIFFVHWIMREYSIEAAAEKIPWWMHSLLISAMLFAIVTLSGDISAFIYFQF